MEHDERAPTFFAPAQILCIDPGGGRATASEARARNDAARALVQRLPTYRAARRDKAVTIDVVGVDVLVAFFTDTVSVVTCAAEFAERSFAAGNADRRMGAHVGPVRRGEDLTSGAPVNGPGAALARATMECADVGHILLSETVAVDASDRPHISDVGRVEVIPGLPLRLYSLARGDIGRTATPTRVAQLSQSRAARVAPAPLPAMAGRFVGREAELTAVADAVEAARVVSLVGPAGIGKTRLAVEAAATMGATHPHGPWFADLTLVREPEDVAWAIARAVGLREFGREPALDRLALYLRELHGLLVLDGCGSAATLDLIARLTAECPNLSILATAREPMATEGERCVPVGGFAVPDAQGPGEQAWRDNPAVVLFERRAYEANREFRLTDRMLGAVADLCAAVGGSPAGICLAAAATAVDAGAAQETLTSAVESVGRGSPDVSRMVAWARERLPGPTREILRRLSAFDGWFGVPAAVAVCEDAAAGDALEALVGRGLLLTNGNRALYRLPCPVASYLGAGARATGGSATLPVLRATYYASPAADLSDGSVDDAELALSWAANHDPELSLRLATRLASAWRTPGDWERTERWLDRLLRNRDGVGVSVLAAALTARSRARVELGSADAALADAEEALAFASSVGDRQAVALARQAQGQALVATGAIEDGMQRHEQALATLRRLEMSAETAHTLADLAAASLLAEDADKAMAYCLEGLRASADVDSAPAESSLMVLRAIAAAQAGDYARGHEAFADALGVHRRVDALRHEASNLLWQARLAARDSGHHSAALYHAERVDALRRVGSADDVAQALRLAAVAACRGGRLSDARRLAGEEAHLRAASGDGREEARALLLKASAEAATGDRPAARNTLVVALGKTDDDATRALCVTGAGVVAHVTGLLAEAATLVAASVAWRRGNEESGDAIVALYAEAATAALAALQEAMPAGAFERAAAQGDAMDLPTAAAYARQRGLV